MTSANHPQDGSLSPAPTPTPPTRGWVKIVLALSLALNLGIGGLVVGHLLSPKPAPGVRSDLGLGPLARAMTREDWRAMRPDFIAKNPDLRHGAEALQQDFLPVLAALRAEPFDAEALRLALRSAAARNEERLVTAREVITDYLVAMPIEARHHYADRIEEALKRSRKPKAEKKPD